MLLRPILIPRALARGCRFPRSGTEAVSFCKQQKTMGVSSWSFIFPTQPATLGGSFIHGKGQNSGKTVEYFHKANQSLIIETFIEIEPPDFYNQAEI